MTDEIKSEKPDESDRGEIFLRYLKDENAFEFKMGENVEAVRFAAPDVDTMIARMLEASDGEKQAEVFMMLVDAAKRDPEGRFVSASNLAVVPGQALV